MSEEVEAYGEIYYEVPNLPKGEGLPTDPKSRAIVEKWRAREREGQAQMWERGRDLWRVEQERLALAFVERVLGGCR